MKSRSLFSSVESEGPAGFEARASRLYFGESSLYVRTWSERRVDWVHDYESAPGLEGIPPDAWADVLIRLVFKRQPVNC